MNPNYSEQPNLNLPTPIFEAGPSRDEQLPSVAGPEQQASSSSQMPSLTLPTDNSLATGIPTQNVSLTATPQVPANGSSSTPLIADDGDLIEKEWVEKAKIIVSKTKNDPYTQTNEVNRFKADYMKRRYNKDIKLTKN